MGVRGHEEVRASEDLHAGGAVDARFPRRQVPCQQQQTHGDHDRQRQHDREDGDQEDLTFGAFALRRAGFGVDGGVAVRLLASLDVVAVHIEGGAKLYHRTVTVPYQRLWLVRVGGAAGGGRRRRPRRLLLVVEAEPF